MTNPTIAPNQTTNPTFEPITLSEAKRQLDIADDDTAHDDQISDLIVMARELIEADTGHIVGTRTFQETRDCWPWFSDGYIELLRRPVASITSIQYVDVAGASQTWASSNYVFDGNRVTPAIFLAYGKSWPSIRSQENAITITYVAGYAKRGLVPQLLKQAVVLQVVAQFHGCMDSIGNAYESLITRMMRSTYP